MLLKLHYNENISHPTGAAFIRGNSPYIWLKELNRWSIPIKQLECYLVPHSLHSLEPAGLFVVFKNDEDLKYLHLMESYGLIAGKLYIPVQAELRPEVSAEELQSLLLWERQVFHPTIGLVGFSLSDKLDLAGLLDMRQPGGKDWNLAHPGIPPKKKLQQIQVQQPNLEEVMASFKELVDTKSLEELMKEEENNSSLIKELFNNLQKGSLKTALSAIQKIKDALSSGNDTDSKSKSPTNPGMFDRLENWIKENLADLEKKRNNEIKRLLNLFDEDTDEALKYAIPLDSPYLNRGTSSPTSKLGPHSTDFDLGKLGGGNRVDSWNVHGYYDALRHKYLRAAQKEIEAKDFKKAAYIYAHLLGDFYSAANVLERGKHFREAAVLYKDHLNNMGAAAECLERGGLLLEAIELFDKLNKHEKVGDLYYKMGQPENAGQYYERSIADRLATRDYLDASRIMQEKINNPERAMQTLFTGWTDSNQSEPCLKQYMGLLYTTHSEVVGSQLEEIFENHTPKAKRPQLLNVLTYINEGKNDPELLDTSRNIAYQIISEELEEGKVSHVHALKKFLPEDPLIASDCSRFTAKSNTRPVETPATDPVVQLDKQVQWISVVCHRNQFLVLGIKDSRLQLARGNWYGNVDYYSWSDHIKKTDHFALITDPLRSNRIILHSSGGLALEEKKLPKNRYFDEELLLFCPTWLSKGYLGISFNSQGGITALAANSHKLTLHHYTMELCLQQSVECQFENKLPFVMTPAHFLSDMIYRNGFYYTFNGNFFLKIAEDGFTRLLDVNAHIGLLAASTQYAKFRVALSTNHGCLLLRQVGGELKAGSNFFAEDMEPVALSFISANNLVVAETYKLAVYQINDETVKASHTITTRSPIVAILSTTNRKQFAYLVQSGEVFILPVEEGN